MCCRPCEGERRAGDNRKIRRAATYIVSFGMLRECRCCRHELHIQSHAIHRKWSDTIIFWRLLRMSCGLDRVLRRERSVACDSAAHRRGGAARRSRDDARRAHSHG